MRMKVMSATENNKKYEIPLKEVSISDLFIDGETQTFEIPIYQRNYAWEEEQVKTLLNDVKDAFNENKSVYYIGTLVSYNKGDQIFEIIDGQQRLTTIRLILGALINKGYLNNGVEIKNKLTYRARKKSEYTLNRIPSVSTGNTGDTNQHNLSSKNKILQKFSDKTLIDYGILNGFFYAGNNTSDANIDIHKFVDYFLHNVHIIHYIVPKDVDLNHYFEVMNSRGEQLEKHEIVKAKLIDIIGHNNETCEKDRILLGKIWEACSNMTRYIQQNLNKFDDLNNIFDDSLNTFNYEKYTDLFNKYYQNVENLNKNNEANKNKDNDQTCTKGYALKEFASINDILNCKELKLDEEEEIENSDSFQPIIDFPNFLLIVLKITLMQLSQYNAAEATNHNSSYTSLILDDKEILKEFFKGNRFKDSDKFKDSEQVKLFAFNLLKARFFLDNYIVHHSVEGDSNENNPWSIQVYTKSHIQNKDSKNKYSYNYKNLFIDENDNKKLVQLLSMFEVTYSQKQRKNYLFYCLYYLMNKYKSTDNTCNEERSKRNVDISEYLIFVEKLADKFFYDYYLEDHLIIKYTEETDGFTENKEIVYHSPRVSFDSVIKIENFIDDYNTEINCNTENKHKLFCKVYGDGIAIASEGIPLYIFNYLDYKIWKLYTEKVKGNTNNFEENFGCKDFDRDIFNNFHFSRTRKSLEHFYPQANATGDENTDCKDGVLNQIQINCLGNFAMIGSEANSSGSNWSPKTKLVHYLDTSKIRFISVASLKFMIMMHICKNSEKEDKLKWGKDEIQAHQNKMFEILGLNPK